ncbi:MAG: sigma-70 family RNA polymerase sigma factor [Deltaproteobacteria bacterium]|nr:sigma-70 family RNA polymerase sigma factor [Deltaproteobacteria bacterium]
MNQSVEQAMNDRKNQASKLKGSEQVLDCNALVEKYMPYAYSIASTVAQTLSSDADIEELNSSARLGLLEAAQRFDPSHKVDFKTFSYYRIRGAIYDGLRKTGWLPRSLYNKLKFEQAANEYLKSEADRSEGDNNDLHEVKETVNSLASIYIISLDAGDEPMDIEDKKANDIEQKAEFQKVKEYMRQAIEELPEKERKLIKMYYFQEKTLEETGFKLGLSKSWTSRLHARALSLLFKKISFIQTKSQQQCRAEAYA